jgi:HEAT repeat protein
VIEAESDPALRREAIHKLGAMGDGARLKALYDSRSDREDRLQVLHAFGIAGERVALADAARRETDPELRAEALRGIGIAGGKQAGPLLVEFYRSSTAERSRRAALVGLMIAGDSASMLELYRQETDPELRRKLLHSITSADPDAALELIDAALKR